MLLVLTDFWMDKYQIGCLIIWDFFSDISSVLFLKKCFYNETFLFKCVWRTIFPFEELHREFPTLKDSSIAQAFVWHY